MAVLWEDRKRILGMPISFTKYILEEDRLILKEGFLRTVENDIMLYRIQDIALIRTFGNKLLGVGSLEITSSDKTHPVLKIKNIRKVKLLKKLLSENVERERMMKRVGTHEFIAGGVQDGDEDSFE